MTSRRQLLLAGAALLASQATALARASGAKMLTRTIPRSGEALPVIGMGTWQTFDVAKEQRSELVAVMNSLLAAGGRVIDSSPMYGRAEDAVGDVLARVDAAAKPFLATKVWTSGKGEGIASMKRSLERMRTDKLDLMQVHNLLDWKTHLPVLREWKQAGKIRYLGVTHYAHGAFAELEKLMRKEQVDFVQLPYNVVDREAEKRLLPAAAETGTAVLVMRPFAEGELFARVRGKSVPPWADEIGCTSWAQLYLKFILGHPAVTCPIPATANPKHMADNLRAGSGPLPDAALRRRIVEVVG